MQMLPTHDWLAARAAATPRKPALLIGDRRWRYAELDTAVSRLAAHLHARGVRPGDHLGMLLPNSLTAVCLVHAAARLGAILVPLNTRLTPAELARQAAHTDARIVYSPDTAAEWLTVNSQWLMVNDDWHTTTPLTVNHLPLTNNHLQSLIFTSGTSGHPKAAMLTFANHFWSATASAYRLGVQPDDLWLSVLPLYHVGGLAVLFRSCLYGTAVDLHPRFDLDAINHALDTKPITLISLVPTMLHRLLATRSHWPASLRLILLGGAAAPPELVAQANALPRKWFMVNGKRQMLNNQLPFTNNHLPLIAPTYGLTEAASQVATMLPADAVRKPGSVGRPFLFTTIRIVDEAGRELPPGEPGEIVVSGPTVMAGYYEREPL
ncbi:MAG: AMP-binding protein, partial [Anaerolineales bacterium]|nr:AMP-binding protein [Anaerolineales bacterium]